MAGYNVNIAQEAGLLSEDVNTMALNSPTSYPMSEVEDIEDNFDVSLDQNASSIHMQEVEVPLSPKGLYNREIPKSPKSPRTRRTIHVKIFLFDKFEGDDWTPREGADKDVLKIQSIIHFEDYETNFEMKLNFKLEELRKFLQQDLCKDVSHGDGLCLFFSSHGESLGLICHDSRLMKFDTVISILKKSVWSNFPDMFVLIFFICCRECDENFSEKPSLEIDDISVRGKLVVVFSVQHGILSDRGKEGTAFIHHLKSCIIKTQVNNKKVGSSDLTEVLNMLCSEQLYGDQKSEYHGWLDKNLKFVPKRTSRDQIDIPDGLFDSLQCPSPPSGEPSSPEPSDDIKRIFALSENTLKIKTQP